MNMSKLQNPFVGLRPYQSIDSMFYFGRSEQSKTLLRLLHQHHFVAVVGSSGAGKSSLIRAGLIPQLEAGFLVQDRDQWLVADTKPGEAPLSNLIDSLFAVLILDKQNQDSHQLAEAISENGNQVLLAKLEPILSGSDSNLFILVDQFEELFRFGLEKGQAVKRRQAEQFVALLLSLSRSNLSIYVCLTMRSDFLGDCDAFHGLPEAINKSQFLVPRLNRSQRQEVIANPVNLAGAKMSLRLVDKLLNETIDTRDDLPILQHALMRTWDEWQEQGAQGPLDIEHYEKVHTIHQALDRHADEALEELKTAEQRRIAKVLFQALTTVDAGNRRIRRPVHLNEVAAIANTSPQEVMYVIDCFCEQNRSFLMLSSQEITDNPLIDISHESLIRQWKTLDGWVEEESESSATYQRLVATSHRYNEGKADPLLANELEHALTWQKQLPEGEAALIWAKRYNKNFTEANEFLQLSEAAYLQKQTDKKEARDYQEKLLKEKIDLEEQKRILAEQQSAEQKRSLTKTRWLSGIMTLITLVMLGVSGIAIQKSNDLKKEQKKTKQALNENILANKQKEEALLAREEALEESELSREREEAAINTAESKIMESYSQVAKIYEEKSMSSISRGDLLSNNSFKQPEAITEYRKALLYALETQRHKLPDEVTAIELTSLAKVRAINSSLLNSSIHSSPILKTGKVHAIAYSPKEKKIASSFDNNIRIWSAQSGNILTTLEGHTGRVNALAYSPDGKVIASGSRDKFVRLWDTSSGKLKVKLQEHPLGVNTLAFSPNGKIIASGAGDILQLWNAGSGKLIRKFSAQSKGINALVFSPDSNVIVSGSDDDSTEEDNHNIRLWDVGSGELINTLSGDFDDVYALAYSPDGKVIASTSSPKTVKPDSKPVEPDSKTVEPDSKTVEPDSKTVEPDSKSIEFDLEDNIIRLWDAESGKEINTLRGHSGAVKTITFSPNGKFILSGSEDKTIRIWNAQSGVIFDTIEKHSDSVVSLAYKPDGTAFASGSLDNTIRLWKPSGEAINPFKGHTREVTSIAYSPNGKEVASGSVDSTIVLTDVQSGKVTRTLKGHTSAIYALEYSPDGNFLASGSADKTILLWDLQSGAHEKITGHDDWVRALTFSPNGKIIASGSDDNTIRFWNAQTREEMEKKRLQDREYGRVNDLVYSPNGKTIAIGSQKGIELVDTQSSELIRRFVEKRGIYALAYSPNGKIIAGSQDNNKIRLWDVGSGKEKSELKGHDHAVFALAYSPNGKVIASGSHDGTIRLWSTESSKTINLLKGHSDDDSGGVMAIAYSPDGEFIASGHIDATTRLWDAHNGLKSIAIKENTPSANSIAYHPNGKFIATGSDDSNIRLMNTLSGEVVNVLKNHTNPVGVLIYSPNGEYIASGSSEKIQVWSAYSGKLISTLEGSEGEKSSEISSLVYSPDSKIIASASDDKIRLWNSESGKLIKVLEIPLDKVVYKIAFSPDGKKIASSYEDSKIRLWEWESNKPYHSIPVGSGGESETAYTLAYSPNGETLAFGSNNNIQIWDLKSKTVIKVLKGHSNAVTEIVFSPNGKVIASGADDSSIRLWDSKSGEEISQFLGHSGDISALAYSPDNKVIVSGSYDSTIRFWSVNKPLYRFLHDFDASEVADVLLFLWELEKEGLDFKYTPRKQSLISEQGHHIAWTDQTRKYIPLLGMPHKSETKMDQVVRWLEERCAYKYPERYGCKPQLLD